MTVPVCRLPAKAAKVSGAKAYLQAGVDTTQRGREATSCTCFAEGFITVRWQSTACSRVLLHRRGREALPCCVAVGVAVRALVERGRIAALVGGIVALDCVAVRHCEQHRMAAPGTQTDHTPLGSATCHGISSIAVNAEIVAQSL
jgi:hypothetical protein